MQPYAPVARGRNFDFFEYKAAYKVVSYKKPCSSKSFLNFRLSSTKLVLNWFLIIKRVVVLAETTHKNFQEMVA